MGQKSRQKQIRRVQEGRLSTLPHDVPWTSLQPSFANGKSQVFDGTHVFTVYQNSRYTVFKRIMSPITESSPEIIHLSIKRNDKKPFSSWRDLQKIKNELVGPECEGIQLFPAESRLVDTSNQMHLWVVNDPHYRIPIGYEERLVAEGNSHNAVQEPFEAHVRPADLVPADVMKQKMREYQEKNRPSPLIPDTGGP